MRSRYLRALGSQDPACASRLRVTFDLQAAPARLGTRLQTLWQRQAYMTKRGFPRYPNFVEAFPAAFFRGLPA